MDIPYDNKEIIDVVENIFSNLPEYDSEYLNLRNYLFYLQGYAYRSKKLLIHIKKNMRQP